MRHSAFLLFASLARALHVPEYRILSGALAEASSRQARIRHALEQQLSKASSLPPADLEDTKNAKTAEKARRRAEQIPIRLDEVAGVERQIESLSARLALDDTASLADLRRDLEADALLGAILREFDPEAHARTSEGRGRPAGFDGLVLSTPRGIPVLVGRQGADTDEAMRRAASGRDLWFQVRDLDGARVLLRTSMARGLEGSRECQQFAADLAAYFSDSRGAGGEDDDDDYVEIMFTDSRHVAKRGSRVGQMKDNKKLGIVRGRPAAVAEVARAAQDSCVIPVWKPRNRHRGRAQ